MGRWNLWDFFGDDFILVFLYFLFFLFGFDYIFILFLYNGFVKCLNRISSEFFFIKVLYIYKVFYVYKNLVYFLKILGVVVTF